MSCLENEFKHVDFGDKRLNDRVEKVSNSFGKNPMFSIPAACGGWNDTKAAYNFLSNPKVSPQEMFESHLKEIIKRSENENILLCPQDTTELDYTTQKNNDAYEYLNRETRKGLYLHATLVVTTKRLCLGVLRMETIKRQKLKSQMTKEEREAHNSLPLEKRESYRWIESYKNACELAGHLPDKQIISMGDRECDFYDFYTIAEAYISGGKPYADWIVRGTWNRETETKDADESTIRKEVGAEEVIATVEFMMPSREGKPARLVQQEIKVKRVKVKPPKNKESEGAESIFITALLTSEKNTPDGCEPVGWLLLTSIDVITAEDALNIVQWYLCRWDIEIYFKVLKSGCAIEKMQLKQEPQVENGLCIYMIIAWRILYLTMLGRNCPDLPADAVFSDFEWKAVCMFKSKSEAPSSPPKLNEMIAMIASLGGFLGRKSDGDPGVKTMWVGLQRMHDMAIMFEVFGEIRGKRETYG
jgi:hypothetical protein